MKRCLVLGSAAMLLLASPVWAGWPLHHQGGYGAWGGCSTCSHDCWATPGCCDRPVSKYDHIWDSYCQEKWCPTTDASYLRPYWHAAPTSYAAPAPVYAQPSCATTLGSAGGPVGYSRPESTRRAPVPTPAAPRASDPPAPPQPSEVVAPPSPPPADSPLELKLLPLSRPRVSKP